MTARTLLLTALALVAFAANSLLCRFALRDGAIDAASFSLIRLVSGVLVLLPLARLGSGRAVGTEPSVSLRVPLFGMSSILGSASLAVYMLGFSYAYVALDTATGALLLFGTVQATMIGYGLLRGERLGLAQWCGLLLAIAGLIFLLGPRVDSAALPPALLMLAAGAGWGVYSLLGRGADAPVARTARNFSGASLIAVVVFFVLGGAPQFPSGAGVALACLSGAVTSGLGYVVWYQALPSLSATSAAIAQLAVPVLAALGGVFLLDEELSGRMALASALTLGGVALANKRRG